MEVDGSICEKFGLVFIFRNNVLIQYVTEFVQINSYLWVMSNGY